MDNHVGEIVDNNPPAGYRVGPGDKLKITVLGEKDLSTVYVVTGTKTISMPLLGSVPVGGLTLEQVQADITARLKDGFILSPSVAVQVDEYRPIFILGEVRRPGSYNYMDGMTYMEAAAVGGGFTYRANTKKIEVIREGYTSKEPLVVRPDDIVLPGDVIRVKERFF